MVWKRLVSYSSIVLAAAAVSAQTPPKDASWIVGAWTLNKDLSDNPQDQAGGNGGGGRYGQHGGGGGGGRHGGFGGGGFGGGGRGGGGGGARSPEDVERLRSALRDELKAPDKMTITQSPNMVVVTTADGRTTRLATDNSKVKDESTGVQRRTKWSGDSLVSEISGLGSAKITETYSAGEGQQLNVTVQIDAQQGHRVLHRVYDADPR